MWEQSEYDCPQCDNRTEMLYREEVDPDDGYSYEIAVAERCTYCKWELQI